MSTPKNINELRNSILETLEWVKQDPRRVNQVKEMSNAAGKAISTVKVELEYSSQRKEKPNIAFLNYT